MELRSEYGPKSVCSYWKGGGGGQEFDNFWMDSEKYLTFENIQNFYFSKGLFESTLLRFHCPTIWSTLDDNTTLNLQKHLQLLT